jgi:hypothetical protein
MPVITNEIIRQKYLFLGKSPQKVIDFSGVFLYADFSEMSKKGVISDAMSYKK